jgi:hypothetical protein
MWINSPALYRLSYRGIFGLLAKNTQILLIFKTNQLSYFAKPRIVAKKISFSRALGFCWLGTGGGFSFNHKGFILCNFIKRCGR